MAAKRKIDWLNHFLEFIVVIIGILIAFQLNTCSEERKEQKAVALHIQNILDESEFNRKNLEATIHYSDTLLVAMDSLLSEVNGDKDPTTMNRLSLQILSINPLYLKKNAYNSLVTSGDVRFINDFDLKNDIIQLYEFYRWAEGIDEVTMDTYQKYYYPYLVEHFDLTQGKEQDIAVYDTKLFKNSVAGYRYTLAMRINQNKETLRMIETFISDHQLENQ
ncbi:MAG: DUF6090 family protein [Flavobacteriales bacterium]|jgi:ribosomal protein S17E|nr:DUF6090 family protein [Flavobacteriales bacterium]